MASTVNFSNKTLGKYGRNLSSRFSGLEAAFCTSWGTWELPSAFGNFLISNLENWDETDKDAKPSFFTHGSLCVVTVVNIALFGIDYIRNPCNCGNISPVAGMSAGVYFLCLASLWQ